MCVQFQITINFVALVVAFVAALSKGETPLNVMQLLWVNLIMDSFAALGEPARMLPAALDSTGRCDWQCFQRLGQLCSAIGRSALE